MQQAVLSAGSRSESAARFLRSSHGIYRLRAGAGDQTRYQQGDGVSQSQTAGREKRNFNARNGGKIRALRRAYGGTLPFRLPRLRQDRRYFRGAFRTGTLCGAGNGSAENAVRLLRALRILREKEKRKEIKSAKTRKK